MVKLICLVAALSLMTFAVGCRPNDSEKTESTGTQVTETVQTQDDAEITADSTATTEETTVDTTDDGNSNNNWTGIY